MNHRTSPVLAALFALGIIAMVLVPPRSCRAEPLAMQDLFRAVLAHPATEASEISAQEGTLRQRAATAALFPRLSAFGKAEVYNSPTNVRPMPPTEVNVAAGDTIPFSREIVRYGLTLDMPLLVRSLYDLQGKSAALAQKTRLSHFLQLVSREASVVTANSGLTYLVQLEAAIKGRIASLTKTKADMEAMVRNGRAAKAELLKVENSINDLETQDNALIAKIIEIRHSLENLTGLAVEEPVPMSLAGEIRPAPYLAERIAEQQVAAARKELDRNKHARIPGLYLSGTLSGNQGSAYNTEEDFFRQYSFASLTLRMPLFDRVLDTDRAIAHAQLRKAEKELANTRIEVAALERMLLDQLPVIDRSRELAAKALDNNRELLAIAKVALTSGRTTTEEYLRYESQVLSAQASLYQAEDQRWRILSKLAVLYGQELKEVVQ